MPVTTMIADIFGGPTPLFLMVGAALICFLYFRSRMHTDNVLQSLAEKGLPIPTELFRKAEMQDMRARYIARGVILIAVGLATVTFFGAMIHFDPPQQVSAALTLGTPLWLPFLGAFPIFAGVAYLILGLLQRKHD